MKKIAILGLGGVGGYYGSKLANAFFQSPDTEIYFFARGEHVNAIREKGLQLITDAETVTVFPTLASGSAKDLGKLDLIIFCCKAFNLHDIAKQFEQNIHQETFLLPLLNGVNNTDILKQVFPKTKCLYGCVYIASKIIAPGVVKQSGAFNNLFFGNPDFPVDELKWIDDIFKDANINSNFIDNIQQKVWEKFLFLSPIATYTSAFNISIGKILESEQHSKDLKTLMNELITLADKLQIVIPSTIIENNFEVMKKLPYETTSSMQVDFINKKQTELETITGLVVAKGIENNLQLPCYKKLYQNLSQSKQ